MLELDKPLQDMIMAALDEIRAWVEACGGGTFTFDDINWDAPTAIPQDAPNVPVSVLLKGSHAIGFVGGVAAGLDMTPLSLLWAIGIDTETPIAAAPKPAPAPTTDRRRAKRSHAATLAGKPRKVKP